MYRLIYKSRSASPLNWETVAGILESSQKNNARTGITGVLLMSKKQFLQVLEGEFEAVNHAFERIVHDPRHRHIRLISFGVVEGRLFEEWQMRGVGVFEFDPPISKPLMEKYGEENEEIRFPEQEWRALALVQDILDLPDLPEASINTTR
jgi:hypothetical protein